MAVVEELLASLRLKAPELKMDEIISLQETLASACRLHDPEHANEMARLVGKLKLGSKHVSPVGFKFSVGSFPAGGLEPTPPSQPRIDSPFSTPPKSTGQRNSERPPRPTFIGERMSLDEDHNPKVFKFDMGKAPEPRSSERKKRISRQLKYAFDEVSSSATAHPPPPPPPTEKEEKQQEQSQATEPIKIASPPAPRKQQANGLRGAHLGDPLPFPPMKENDPPCLSTTKDKTHDLRPGFCLGATDETTLPHKAGQRFRPNRQPPKMAANLRKDATVLLQPPAKLVFDQHLQHKEEQIYDTQYGQAVQLYESAKYHQAVQLLTEALSQAPNTWMLYAASLALRGGCYLLLDQPIEALRDSQEAVGRDPSLYSALNRCGRIKLFRGDIEAAESDFLSAKRAAVQQPFHTDAVAATATADTGIADCKRYKEQIEATKASISRAAELTAAANEDNSSVLLSASRRKQESLKAAARAEAERARRSADEALLSAPRDPLAARLKAIALATMLKWTELEAFCNAFAPSAAPYFGAGHSFAFHATGLNKTATNNPIEPGELSAALCKCDTFDSFGQASLAELYAQSLRHRETPEYGKATSPADEALAAIAASDHAPDAARERSRIKLQRAAKFRRAKERADSAYTRGHYRAAVAMYRDALRLEGDDNDALRASIHANLAAAALVLDRPSEAVDHCTKALSLRPQYMRARLRRGRAHVKLDHFTEALKDFDIFLQSKTDFSGVDSHDAVQKERDTIERDLLRRRTTRGSTEQHQDPPPPPPNHDAHSKRFHFNQKNSQQHASNQQQQRRGHHASQQHNGAYFAGPKNHKTNKSGASSARSRSTVNAATTAASTHYNVLGLGPDAHSNEIKRAYARLALQYHPDRNKSPHATAAMARINEAYECLKDPASRASYDATAGLQRRRRGPTNAWGPRS